MDLDGKCKARGITYKGHSKWREALKCKEVPKLTNGPTFLPKENHKDASILKIYKLLKM